MENQAARRYITTLYLKSRNNFRNGFDQKQTGKLAGVSINDVPNITHYLSGKRLIDTGGGYGDNVVLSPEGIEYVENLQKGKEFKIIKFKEARFIQPPTRRVQGFIFTYSITDETGKIENKSVGVYASDILTMAWQLPFHEKQKDAEKILLQFAKNKVIEKLKEGTLLDHEEMDLMMASQPPECPYKSEELVETALAEYQVEMSSKPLMEEIKENKLAAAIIELRDRINAIFEKQHRERLLLLNQERNLLDFFKTATTEEEFMFRLSSLAEISRNFNVPVLRKLTGEQETQIRSVALLERYLTLINKPSKDVIDTLRQFGKIRQGYPAHQDVPDVIKGYQHFGLKYPVEDFEQAWTTLLNHYLVALEKLFNLFAEVF